MTTPILTNNNAQSIQPTTIISQTPSQKSTYSSARKEQQKDQQTPNVTQAKQKLDNLIEDLNDKLVNHFKVKEEALLNQYKQELIEQQRKLSQLKNTTNEEQIRTKMLERKTELEKERNHLIQTNMYFSQKCQQYKQTYNKLIQQSKDLQKQIQFLDNQITTATEKKILLADEIGSVTDRVYLQNSNKSQKKVQELPQIQRSLPKMVHTQSMRKVARSLHLQSDLKSKKSMSIKNFQKFDKSILNKSPLEKIFEQSVEEVKNRRKTKRVMPNLKGEQFSEIEKRAIMEQFLSNEDVKRKLYELIFEQNDKNYKRPLPINEKVKISFDELGI